MPEWKNGIAKIVLPTPFPVGDVNVYVIKGDRLTLVDVGPKMEDVWDLLKVQLKELHLQASDIEQVILTHHHADHSGLLDFFPNSLEVYGHSVNDRWIYNTETFLAQQKDFFSKMFTEFGIPENFFNLFKLHRLTSKYSCNRALTGFLQEGDSPLGLLDWKVVETPGHAQSHIGLYREKDGVYIGGDQLLAHVSPNPLIEPPVEGGTERPKSLIQLNQSLNKLHSMPISLVYSGHGSDIYNKNELIEIRLLEQHERAYKVKKWLEKESLTVFEVCQRLFPKVYQQQFGLTLSETVAQFDYLTDRKEININIENGVIRYFAA